MTINKPAPETKITVPAKREKRVADLSVKPTSLEKTYENLDAEAKASWADEISKFADEYAKNPLFK